MPWLSKTDRTPMSQLPKQIFHALCSGSCARMPILCFVSTVEALKSRRDSKILKSHMRSRIARSTAKTFKSMEALFLSTVVLPWNV